MSSEQQRLCLRLREQAREVYRLIAGVPEPELNRRLEAGQWSLKELLCHLRRTQQIFQQRVEAMLRADNPPIEIYEPDADAEFDRLRLRPTTELLAGFLTERQQLLKRLESLSAEQWDRPGRHPEFPGFDVKFQIEYMAHHEAHHLYQMFQRRALLAASPI